MSPGFPVLVVAAALAIPAVLPLASSAFAQTSRDLPSPSTPPQSGRGGLTFSLDTLFGALKIAPDEASAKAIEDRIWAIWMSSDSDTCNLLMSRVKDATEDKDYDLAINLLDAVVTIKPDYVEAWNRRATLHYIKHEYGRALADIREVLAREPRHFGALAGLGLILQDIGDDKHALEAYQAALAIDPHLRNLPDVVKTLREKVEGRDI
ncbi:MAG TPA: tetratricopeptide repeat protein [Xanthobacteraceae bacterium]|nr:tetratricopeptide repeat protein [Xanthobacteraceae bacterium]